MASSPVTAPQPNSTSPSTPATAASPSSTPPSPPSPSATPPPQSPPSPPPASPPPPVATPPPKESPTPPPSPPPPPSPSPPPPKDSPTPPSPPPPSSNPPSSSSDQPPPSTKSPSPPENDDYDDNDGGSSSSSPTKSSPPVPPSHSGSKGTPSPNALSPPKSSSKGSSSSDKDSSDSSSDDGSSHINMPVLIGVAAGVGLFFVLLMIVSLVCCTKKKKKNRNSLHYYDSSAKGSYYSSGPPHKWQNGQDHIVKLPPPPGAVGQQGGGWQQSQSAMSGEMSSAFSGSHGPPLPPPSPTIALGFNKSTFSFDELAAATSGFSEANLLGQGGFGYVHKGVLPNGKEIAVKQLKSGSGQGEREFQAEVEIISRVHHRHLVSLVGYCIAGNQRMLVYEYVPNKTLEYHLHGKGLPVMDWPSRLKIALGSAKGLAYLHEDCHPRIIHRDIKSANILLDYKFEAMVADFGLAKLSSDNYTHVSTRVMGTFGYLAPEYASSGKLTEKSDVFSFGIMLLELITGRRPVDTSNTAMEDSLVDWARPIMTRALTDGNFEELVDPRLENNYNTMEMTRVVACAAASVRHSARRRPKMSQIVRALEGDSSLDDLTEGVKPGQSMFFSSGSDYDSGSYASNMSRFRKVALESNAFSDEYSGMTSEYGLNPSSSSSEGFSSELNPSGPPKHRPQPSH